MSTATNVLNTKAAAYGVAILVGTAVVYWIVNKLLDKASDAATAAGNAVNPTSDQNLAYRGVNAVGSAISGDEHWTLGGWIYDVTHPGESAGTPPYVPRKLAVREESKLFSWLTDKG